jgi:hypothetical protein
VKNHRPARTVQSHLLCFLSRKQTGSVNQSEEALRRGVAYQFNRPSPVSYLCSVNTARPTLAVSSYTQNPTESGNRRQMATPTGSNLTIRWVDLNLLFSNRSSSSTCKLQVTSAFTSRENGPEAGISGRWRHLAEVTGPFDRPTLVCYWWSADNSRPAGTVFELFALFEQTGSGNRRKVAPRGKSNLTIR